MAKEKPYNGGQWTTARYHSFIKSALRNARWPVRYQALKNAECGHIINPETNRKNKAYLCAECGGKFPQKQVKADHIAPVVPVTGFDSWDGVIERLFCEIDGYQILCNDCHQVKSNEENRLRRENAKL